MSNVLIWQISKLSTLVKYISFLGEVDDNVILVTTLITGAASNLQFLCLLLLFSSHQELILSTKALI